MVEPRDAADDSTASTAALDCAVLLVTQLSAAERVEMLALMTSHFEGIDAAQFFRDLDEKMLVVLVRATKGGAIRGFSTITKFETTEPGAWVVAIFAGDTVIDPEFWGHPGWVYAWARHGYDLARGLTCKSVYLLLLTSTHRTYRFMPGFFREYWPRPDRAIPPDIQARLDALVRVKFRQEYDPARGVVVQQSPTPVRAERRVAGAVPGDDELGRFFLSRNPEYERGDFLCCIAEFSWKNLTRLGRRVVSAGS